MDVLRNVVWTGPQPPALLSHGIGSTTELRRERSPGGRPGMSVTGQLAGVPSDGNDVDWKIARCDRHTSCTEYLPALVAHSGLSGSSGYSVPALEPPKEKAP